MPRWTEGTTLLVNLQTMGKIEHGDLLTVAEDDGRLRRKTNFLTQAFNDKRNRDSNLFVQINDVLEAASTRIKENVDGNQDLARSFVAAYRGLERLLSTYRSKGSKKTADVDSLTEVLAAYSSLMNANAGPATTDLKKLAQNAVTFVDNTRVRSTNNDFETPWLGREEDHWLLVILVRAATLQGLPGQPHQELRRFVKDLMRAPGLTRQNRREHLENYLLERCFSQTDPSLGRAKLLKDRLRSYYQSLHDRSTAHAKKVDWNLWMLLDVTPEELRIRMVRKAMKAGFGNCLEKSCIAATHLVEESHGRVGICRVGGKNYDHQFVLMSSDAAGLEHGLRELEGGRIREGTSSLPRDTWVVDGWTSDFWGLRDWFNRVGNPRQMVVRTRIRKAIADSAIGLAERVSWPPQPPNDLFRLRFATVSKALPAHDAIRRMLGEQYFAARQLINPTVLSDFESGLDDSVISNPFAD